MTLADRLAAHDARHLAALRPDARWVSCLGCRSNLDLDLVAQPCPICALAPLDAPQPWVTWRACYRCGIVFDSTHAAGCPVCGTLPLPLDRPPAPPMGPLDLPWSDSDPTEQGLAAL